MTNKELEDIKRTKKWPTKFSDFYSRFFFILFPLAILAIGYIMLNSSFKNSIEELRIPAFVVTTIGIFLTLFTGKRLWQNQTFESFEVEDLTFEKLDKAIKKANFETTNFYKSGYFIAKTKTSWFSWGEEITIIQDGNRILVNSRPTVSAFSFQPITILKDRRNIKKIIMELNTATNSG